MKEPKDESLEALQNHYDKSVDKYLALVNLHKKQLYYEGKYVSLLMREQGKYNKMLDAAISEFRMSRHKNKLNQSK